jgi:stearoyl-CoA desaturase (delta-9 desaturase)
MRPFSIYHPVAFKMVVLIGVSVPFLATVLAIYLLWKRAVSWSDLALLAAMYSLIKIGEEAGIHRMLAHRSFQLHPVVKFVLLVLGSMAVEGPVLEWAAIHIKHHARADREGDPHSPGEGFFHAHMGWFFKDRIPDPNVYCRHLLKDPIVVFVNRTYGLWVVLSLVVPFLIGGWTGFLWAGLVRVFLVHHVTFSTNSICHTFGKREFETTDRSHNQWIVALLSFGQGWHNNHHAFPRSAYAGVHWWQIDLSGYLIWTLERLGLARDVHCFPPDLPAHYSRSRGHIVLSMPHSVEEQV